MKAEHPNYFTFLDIPISFDVDASLLEQRYFSAQRATHPDKHTQKSSAHRQQALQHSMLANDAYDTLKSPLKRARHLLALQGISLEGKDAPTPSPTLLMDIMEVREALQSANTKEEVARLAEENNAYTQALLANLSKAFAEGAFPLATHLTLDLSYRIKFSDELRIKQKLLP